MRNVRAWTFIGSITLLALTGMLWVTPDSSMHQAPVGVVLRTATASPSPTMTATAPLTPAPTATTTPTAALPAVTKRAWLSLLLRHPMHLPDLIVDDVFNTLCPEAPNPRDCGCISGEETGKLVARIRNQGAAHSGAFTTRIDTPLHAGMLRVANLRPGRRLSIIDGDIAPSAEVVVDAENEVVESREDNNVWAGSVAQPTVPATCTPTPPLGSKRNVP